MRPIHALSLLVAASLKLLTPMIALAQAPAPHEHDLGELGSVDIATSCSAEANAHVQRGLALLHHMMYERAAKAFAAAAAVQPACAMAYWGQAMSFVHPIWSDPPPAAAFAKGALLADTALAEGAKTSRERAYIEAIQRYYRAGKTNKEAVNLRAFAGGWAAVHELYPDDPDAALFYALAQLATADPTDKTFAQQRRAGELIERVFARYPNHPGAHHYFIHAYDYPPLAARALQVARDYGRIAPEVPHALHMPSHIFTRLGLWEDSIAWNERSAAAALKSPVGSAVSLHYLHALDYLAYAHLQRAEDEKAAQILAKLQRLQPPVQPELASAYALAAVPARIALERQDWAGAMALAPRSPEWFAWSSFPAVEAITHFARALGAAHRRNVSLARQSLDTLAALRDRAAESNAYWGTQVEIQRLAALAWLTFEQGERRQGIETMRQAAQLEASTEKHPVTPGEVLPASELLADMLLEMGEHAAARKQYAATLERSPNRFNSSYGLGRAAELAGDEAAAIKSYRQLVAFAVTDGKARTDRLQHAARYLASRQLAPRASAPRPGRSPTSRLKARLNAASDPKPTAAAMWAMLMPWRSSRPAATCSRHLLKYWIAGIPMSSANRCEKAVRDRPASRPRESSVQGCAGRPCIARNAAPTWRSRRPASQPVDSSGKLSMYWRTACRNINSLIFARIAWPPARGCWLSSSALRIRSNVRMPAALDRLTCSMRGNASNTGLYGRASQPRKPQTKRAFSPWPPNSCRTNGSASLAGRRYRPASGTAWVPGSELIE